MAEVVAGVVAAEQAISTTLEVGVPVGIALAKSTMPLKATFTRIATAPDPLSPDSLARSHHTICVVLGKAYIFGGRTGDSQTAGNEMHVVDLPSGPSSDYEYKMIPALSVEEGGDVPQGRFSHTACSSDERIFVFGGTMNGEEPLDERGRVWSFSVNTLQWTPIDPANTEYPTLHSHSAVLRDNALIVHDGLRNTSSKQSTLSPSQTTWKFDLVSKTWTHLPTLEASSVSPPSMILAHNTLYALTGKDDLQSAMHRLDVGTFKETPSLAGQWEEIPFPTNPLTPGPRPRQGAGLSHVTTGLGRDYLLLLLGQKYGPPNKEDDSGSAEFWSELWTYQLPSSGVATQAKDAIRAKVGADSKEGQWAEVEILPPDVEKSGALEGKAHPGPRGYFACASVDGKSVVLWGGLDPKGDVQGDGWVVSLQ